MHLKRELLTCIDSQHFSVQGYNDKFKIILICMHGIAYLLVYLLNILWGLLTAE